ncbi:MAG: class I SAM-dependent methyltransferase [Drouetiella hepatica Uher 2000/2452]|jgi:ubiquinone/menaquinone biosynthesis C-methylase UbiE|uniref:Class I SAM-dependent methyltransferase n=1 Tax=Drouetiella hepatica Uher 2000/2452 TaxID=904376 RepID=A0A951QGN2_9CYAN|nr:class I SAM-dependent methyltransferase [Drouetiella hepatica Uher 2000/2452]
MVAANVSPNNSSNTLSRLINGILSIKPLSDLAKHQARSMMIKRAESIGVYWRKEVEVLRSRHSAAEFSPEWDDALRQTLNPDLVYPDYYLRSFHAYEQGNLSWEAAMEVEVAAHAVHARIFPDAGAQGDAMLRQSYHAVMQPAIATPPQDILDLGCSVGMSTFALQDIYPHAQITGLDLSPYFLAIAQYRAQNVVSTEKPIHWLHAAAESTGLPDASFDLVSTHLMFHELPQSAAIAILKEARRLLRPGGHLSIMDMNPKSEIYAKMPPYILTLLKSTEPYLDQYFTLDLEQAIADAGFTPPTLTCNSPRHRTVIAQVR